MESLTEMQSVEYMNGVTPKEKKNIQEWLVPDTPDLGN